MNENSMNVAVIEKLQSLVEVQEIGAERGTDKSVSILSVPKGFELKSTKPFLDEYLPSPERKKGTARLDDLDSFIGHVLRTKDEYSVIFADKSRNNPKLLAVYDYNLPQEAGALARFGQHRARHAFPVSDEWKSWTAKDKQPMDQESFAKFLEDRILDVAEPALATPRTKEILAKMGDVALATPTKLLTLSRGLSVHVASKLTNQVRLGSGEVDLVWQTEHQDENGEKLSVPGAFLILVPLFQGGVLYPIIVRLRYQAARGAVMWHYALYRTEEMFELAIKSSIERVATETGLPVFAGMPEGQGLKEDE